MRNTFSVAKIKLACITVTWTFLQHKGEYNYIGYPTCQEIGTLITVRNFYHADVDPCTLISLLIEGLLLYF